MGEGSFTIAIRLKPPDGKALAWKIVAGAIRDEVVVLSGFPAFAVPSCDGGGFAVFPCCSDNGES